MRQSKFLGISSARSTKSGALSILILMLLLGPFLSGCGSMAVDRLLSVADKGIAAAQKNDELLIEALKKQILSDIEDVNQGFDRDVDLVASGSLKTSDGTSVSMDAAWVKEARVGYFLLLDSKYKQLQDLERIHKQIQGNLKTVGQLIDQSRELNASYITTTRVVGHLLDQVESDAIPALEHLGN